MDLPTSPSAALPQRPCGRVVGEEDYGAAAVTSPPSVPTPSLPQQSEPGASPLEEQWGIKKIVGRRRVGKGVEYKVRWDDTWLPTSELGNAQRLLQEFEAQRRAQRGLKPHRAT